MNTLSKQLLVSIGMLLLALLSACGGENASVATLDENIYLNELGAAGIAEVCAWQAAEFGAADGVSYLCGQEGAVASWDETRAQEALFNGEEIPENLRAPLSEEDCMASPLFETRCTLGSLRDCFLAAEGDVCRLEIEPACEAFRQCVKGVDAENPPANFFDFLCPYEMRGCQCYTPGQQVPENTGRVRADRCWNWKYLNCYWCNSPEVDGEGCLEYWKEKYPELYRTPSPYIRCKGAPYMVGAGI